MSLPVCPVDCSSNLPVQDFSLCAPDVNNGQIAKIFYTTKGNPLANWTSAVEWDSRIENDAVGASKIRMLMVVGDLPAPEAEEREISGGRKVQGVRRFTMNARVDETNLINHDAARALQCNTGNHLFWFETRDHRLFGGSSGIEGKIKVDIIIPEAYTDIITYQYTFTWDAQFMPEMIVSPITDETGDQFPS